MADVDPTETEQQGHKTGAAAASDGHVVNRYGYNGNALSGNDNCLSAFGGEFQPGLHTALQRRKFANPAPLGLCAFALTTFVLSAVNLGARGVTVNSIVVPLAFGYGGFVQFFAGMW
jgi:hypothetical protein